MESRMDRYYKDDMDLYKRSKKNEELYKDISKEISELENLPIPDNSNEIDIDSLKEIISSRDEYRKAKELSKTFISEKPLVEEKKDERKVYDINVLLEKAKDEVGRNNKFIEEKKINTNFLTNLEEIEIPSAEDAVEVSSAVVKETPSNTDSLPLDILVDLKGTDDTVVTDPIVKEEITMIKKIKDGETFYSGSFNFSKKDFDESEEDEDFIIEKSHTGIKVFFLILGFIALAVAMYLIITKYVL